jgi:hypothetical protein
MEKLLLRAARKQNAQCTVKLSMKNEIFSTTRFHAAVIRPAIFFSLRARGLPAFLVINCAHRKQQINNKFLSNKRNPFERKNKSSRYKLRL